MVVLWVSDGILLSIVVPCLNEVDKLQLIEKNSQQWKDERTEIIIVDGGSQDGSAVELERIADIFLRTQAGRSIQMNAGAKKASGKYILFLHADTQLPKEHLVFKSRLNDDFVWGFFKLSLDGEHWWARMIEAGINIRSRLSSVATGDQTLFVKRQVFDKTGGMPMIALMEDVVLSKRLRKKSLPMIWTDPVITSSRRWQKNGVLKTVFLMWYLRLLFFLKVSPDYLHKKYY